jgi:hypothetical protein
MVRLLHSTAVVRLAVHLTCAFVAAATMSCVLITPPDYEPDAGASPPPYIVWDSAFPGFFPAQQLNDAEPASVYTVTVGDPDVNQELRVRFCVREKTDSNFILVNAEKIVAPTPTHTLDRTRVSTDPLNPCTVSFPGSSTSDTHYLYVVVTDGVFRLPNVGCDVPDEFGSASAAWPYTCDKPK